MCFKRRSRGRPERDRPIHCGKMPVGAHPGRSTAVAVAREGADETAARFGDAHDVSLPGIDSPFSGCVRDGLSPGGMAAAAAPALKCCGRSSRAK